MTAPHHTREEGIVAVLPRQGPCSERAVPCRVVKHHVRQRKTGPPWGSVVVARCREHGLAFTVYPPGQVPYGRLAWVEMAPGGGEIERAEESPQGTTPPTPFFAAAADAARRERWPRDSAPSPPDAVRSTQRRRVGRAARVLGLVAGGAPDAETVAGVTGLPAGSLVETAGRLSSSSDLVQRGLAVTRVIEDLARRAGRALMDRLAVLGHLAGLWGRPSRWSALSGRLLRLGEAFWHGTPRRIPPPAAGAGVHDFGPRDPP